MNELILAYLIRQCAEQSPSAQPGEIIIYHAWEPYQFKEWKGQQEATASAWKAIHLAGGYCHLQYHILYAAPSHAPRAAKVEVKFARAGRRMPAIKITANAPGLKVSMASRIEQ